MARQILARVLSYHKSQRYAIERSLQLAWNELRPEHPGCSLEIVEVRQVDEILRYTPVIAFASLVIDEKLVCVGRCPSKDEVLAWLREAIQETGRG